MGNTKKQKNNIYTHKFDNLDEVNQFLKKLELPQLTQYEINILNWDIIDM